MSVLATSPVSTDRFHWHAAERMFSAEASDLGRSFRLGRVYDDACDVGFTLVSARTGREIPVALVSEHRDAEGELQWQDFRPVAGASGATSSEFIVRLWND